MRPKHTGQEYIYVICSVCQGKFFRKDTVLVKDKYNWQNGRIVCKWDIDKVNPQSYPVRTREHKISQPQHLTGEANIVFSSVENDDRTPSAPLNAIAKAAIFTDGVELTWEAPEDQGSSDIVGYIIKRATPQSGVYTTIELNTGSPNPYYNDTSANQTISYSYKIAAINGAGVGVYSDEFFYPTPNYPFHSVIYIIDENNNAIIDENGNYLTDNTSV